MRPHRALSLAAAAAVAACGSDTTAPFTNVDVDAVVNQMVNAGIASYVTPTNPTPDPGMPLAVPQTSTGTSGCSYSAMNQMFECAPVTVSGIVITRAYQLLDASSRPLSSSDPTLIAAIRVVTDAEGTLLTSSGASMGVAIDRHEDATVSGLRTAHHVVNGTATESIVYTPTSGSQSSTTSTSATTDLLLPPPSGPAKWPLAGTITTDRTFAPSFGTTPLRYVFSFDGTSIMRFTLTIDGETITCTKDLAASGPPAECFD